MTVTVTAPTAPTRRTSPRSAARWAAGGYLTIFALAVVANFLALGSVLRPGDPTATAQALSDAEGTFRLGMVAFLGIFLADVGVAWALYVLFRPVHRDLSLAAAWFRLTYSVVLGAALALLFVALWLADTPEAFGNATDDAILLALQTFDVTWVAGLAAFGVHLVILGRLLVVAAGPRWLGTLLMLAGAAYVVDTVAHVVLADYESYSDFFLGLVALPSVLGELAFTGWLLLAGRRQAITSPQ